MEHTRFISQCCKMSKAKKIARLRHAEIVAKAKVLFATLQADGTDRMLTDGENAIFHDICGGNATNRHTSYEVWAQLEHYAKMAV